MVRLGVSLALGLAGVIVAGMAIVAALGFASLSLYFYLTNVTTPALAALGVSGAALIFSCIVIVLAGVASRRQARKVLTNGDEIFGRFAEAVSLGKALGLEGRNFLTANLSKTSMVAFGIGLVMGISPKLRKSIMDLLLR